MSQIIGHISQVIGPVVDVYFEGLPGLRSLPLISHWLVYSTQTIFYAPHHR